MASLLLPLFVVTLLLSSCEIGRPFDRAPGPDANVDDNGFTVALEEITVTGPAGVAESGTGVHLKKSEVGIPEGLDDASAASDAFDLSMDNGGQPEQPVTVTFQLSEDQAKDPHGLFFMTRRGDTGDWEGLPVAVDGVNAVVTLTHFSWGIFGWAKNASKWLLDGALKAMKLTFDKPACVGKSARHDGRVYKVSIDGKGSGKPLYPCIESTENGLEVSVQSNSPLTWSYEPTRGNGTGLRATAPLDFSAIITLLIFDALQGNEFSKKTLLVPGGKARIRLPADTTEAWTKAVADPALGLVPVIIAGIDMYLGMAMPKPKAPGKSRDKQTLSQHLDQLIGADRLETVGKANDTKNSIECLVDIVKDSGDDTPKNAIGYATSIVKCLGTVLSGTIGAVVGPMIAIATSLLGLLATQVFGVFNQLLDQGQVRLHVTSKPAAPQAQACPTAAQVASAIEVTNFAFDSVEKITCSTTPGWAVVEFNYTGGGSTKMGEAFLQFAGGWWNSLAQGGHGGDFYDLSHNPPKDMPDDVLRELMKWRSD